MLIRLRPFLIAFVLCLAPLLLLALLSFWLAVHSLRVQHATDLQAELTLFITSVNRLLDETQQDLIELAQSESLKKHIAENAGPPADGSSRRDLPLELKAALLSVLDRQKHFETLVCFGTDKQPLFVAETTKGRRGVESLKIYTENFVPGLPKPSDEVWSAPEMDISTSPLTPASFGSSQSLSLPVRANQTAAAERMVQAVLVGQVNIDSVLADAARPIEAKNESDALGSMVIALDGTGTLLYHPNDALKHQPVAAMLPTFAPVAQSMMKNNSGVGRFTSLTGREYVAVFGPLPRLSGSAAVARSPALALAVVRRDAWIQLGLSVLLALAAALVLTRFRTHKSHGLETVTKGVAAIAHGELDHHIDVRSGDDARIIADNVNLMTGKLREQLAREAEAKQFESFVRLSAMLTHDLKNAIEALSLIVGNMEKHFDNEQFRTDVMKSLTFATQKLKGLVSRLTNPVTTLSGEHKRPKAADLTLLLRRMAELIGEPMRSKYEIELKFSEPVYALVDPERIERVIENLIINALEAMSDDGGKLTIEAGTEEGGKKVFFSVTDTGKGMSRDFIDQRLFRPFATTKTHGVGLGLYTCREVVRANAGTIYVQSEEGIGTTFRVVLPSASV